MTVNLLGGDELRPRGAAGEWLWPLLPLGLSAFALSALVSYHVRQPLGSSALQRAIIGVYEAIGFVPAFFFFLLLFSWSSIWFVTGRIERPWGRLWRLLAFTAVIATAMNLQHPPGQGPVHLGAIGGWVAGGLLSVFGYWLSALAVVPLALATFLLATDFCFYRYFERSLPARSQHVARGPMAPTEYGVEPEVADHLKSLAAATGSAAVWEPAGSAPATATTVVDVASVRSAEPATGRRPESVADQGEYESRRRRRSYYERRQEQVEERRPEALAAGPAAEPGEAVDATAASADEFSIAVGETAADSRAGAAWTGSLDTDVPALEEPVRDPVEAERPGARRRGKLAPIVVSDSDVPPEDEPAAGTVAPDIAEGAAVAGATAPHESETSPAPGADADPLAAAADEVPTVEIAGEQVTEEQVTEEQSDAGERAIAAEAAAAADGQTTGEEATCEPRAEAAEEGESVRATEAATPESDVEQQVVLIPRSPEGVRQRRLFEPQVDEGLIEEAVEIARAGGRRISAGYLQRKLRVDYEQARDLLQVLVQRGVVGDDEIADAGRR